MSNLKNLAVKARHGHYAIPAFNVSNLEMTQAVIRAAVKLKSPVIVQTSDKAINYAGNDMILKIIKQVAEDIGKAVPIVSHLDHGKDLRLVKNCITLGYGSVHMDASEKSYKDNIRLTSEAVKFAKKYKVAVQGELGALLGAEGLTQIKKGFDYRQMMTDPKKAADFVKRTGIDTLAVNVGTIHGAFKGIEKIDLARLRQIASSVKVPLVLHGGSGNKASEIKNAIKIGVSIINIDTDLRIAWSQGFIKAAKTIDFKKKLDPRQVLSISTNAVQRRAEEIIKIFGSNNKA